MIDVASIIGVETKEIGGRLTSFYLLRILDSDRRRRVGVKRAAGERDARRVLGAVTTDPIAPDSGVRVPQVDPPAPQPGAAATTRSGRWRICRASTAPSCAAAVPRVRQGPGRRAGRP